MVGAIRRMNILKELLNLRVGPGAAILPPNVTRIHMDFAKDWNDGHLGPRRFFKRYLPRLKYHNPSIPMIVNRRSDNNAGPATLSVYLSKADASSADAPPPGPSTFPASFVSSTTNTTPAPPPLPHETVTRIDMKHQVPEAILAEFLKVTNAKVLEPTADETAQLEALAIRHERAAEDRRKMLEYTERQRRERMLRFRGAAASSS